MAWAGFQLGCPGWARAAAAELVAAGLSNKQVAEQLCRSVTTVDTHLRRVYGKLGVTSRAQLARRLGPPLACPPPARPRDSRSKIVPLDDLTSRGRAYGGPHARVRGRDLRPGAAAPGCICLARLGDPPAASR